MGNGDIEKEVKSCGHSSTYLLSGGLRLSDLSHPSPGRRNHCPGPTLPSPGDLPVTPPLQKRDESLVPDPILGVATQVVCDLVLTFARTLLVCPVKRCNHVLPYKTCKNFTLKTYMNIYIRLNHEKHFLENILLRTSNPLDANSLSPLPSVQLCRRVKERTRPPTPS